jgi:sortase B
MFHYLLEYKKVSYYKERPVITFDNIYSTGEWKIFAVFITNGSDDKEPFFNYTKSTFKNSTEFLNFIYQLRIRSVLNIDTVDINENDQLLTLSTCSYEIDNYRTVIVARKVREGEDTTVDVDSVTKNPQPLYPQTYYNHYEGEAPELYETFEEALENGAINWYTPVGTQ